MESGQVDCQRECVGEETFFGNTTFDTNGRMVRRARYKYVLYAWGKYREQLFDMEADPGELVNLAVEARYRETLARHRSRLAEWIEETDDRCQANYARPDDLPPVPGKEF